jgi:hypothetical protein
MRGLFVLLTLSGCQLVFPVSSSDGPRADDAMAVDQATPGDSKPRVCFGEQVVRICVDAPPTEPITLPAGELDTDRFAGCAAHDIPAPFSDPGACVILGTTIAIEGTVRATGGRPLVLIATTSIRIDGVLDASSSVAAGAGAGVNADSACPVGAAAGRGGGAGGSFHGTGGNGGDTVNGDGTGGDPVTPTLSPVLRAGCRGGDGGGNASPVFGHPGGALALIAPVIEIKGVVNASGSGGRGGLAANGLGGGGGGGGSGGMIHLDGMVEIANNAQVFANGGGGGEGGGTTSTGSPGQESTAPLVIAQGGSGSTLGGDGGQSHEASLDGDPGVSGVANTGSGGGGGGAGRIRVFPAGQTFGLQFSPAPS